MAAISVPEEERFATNAKIMAAAVHGCVAMLYDQGYRSIDPDLVSMIAAAIGAFNKKFLIEGFIENSHAKCWDNIKIRNEQFFSENSGDIFKYLPIDRVNLFKDLFLARDPRGVTVVPQNMKDEIWDLLDSMVKISIKYIHRERKPSTYLDENKVLVQTYKNSFYDNVNLAHHAKNWNIKLEFPMTY